MSNAEKLFILAKQNRENAYAPYSNFKVGAAILTTNGKFFGGCNVENSSYPCGICAEAGAIAAMIAAGETKIAEILVIADTECITPCGNCLQKIAEFADASTVIYCANLNKIVKSLTLNDLFQPFSLR